MINLVKDIIYNLIYHPKIVINSNNSLSGKVIIITGASKGIGKATAEVLEKSGANMVLFSRNINELKNSLPKSNPNNKLIMQADVTQGEDCKKVVKETIKKFGKVDVLINNAGVFKGRYIEKLSLKEWEDTFAVNITGAFLMSKEVIPYMKKANNGLIINIGSKISHNANVDPQKVLYATTKYAVEGLSLSLSKELRPFGIRVSCLMPGTVNTFRSLSPRKFLSPYDVGQVISMIIGLDDVDFESIIIKSKLQSI